MIKTNCLSSVILNLVIIKQRSKSVKSVKVLPLNGKLLRTEVSILYLDNVIIPLLLFPIGSWQYPIVHLATHGYYLGILPEGTDLMPASYDESLSLSGIAFAGSSSALLSDDFNAGQHDGILSAREIAQMDFSGVDLIVLSACQTAQGFMTDDGVYGIQRSLKRAGVKAMILSLWSVDDDAAPIMMQAFHKHLQTEDIHTAFIHAREDLMATKYEQSFDPVLMKGSYNTVDFSLHSLTLVLVIFSWIYLLRQGQ